MISVDSFTWCIFLDTFESTEFLTIQYEISLVFGDLIVL